MGVALQRYFNLRRQDLITEADDQFAAPADNEQIVFLVEAAEIACVEPAFGVDRGGSQPRIAIIASHHIRSANKDLTRTLTVRQIQANLDTGPDPADRAIPARRLEARLGNGGRTLRHAIAVMQGKTEQGLGLFLDCRRERRASDRYDSQDRHHQPLSSIALGSL